MNIDPLSNSNINPSYRRHSAFGASGNEAAATGGFEQLSADRSATVRETLASLPEIRPEVVARGRELLPDSNYPSQEIVEKIAALITPLSED